jgi:hypothetical protein
MESKLRFIAADTPYEVDELFVDGIMELTAPDRMRILKQIQDAIPDMDYDEENTHYGGGRLGGRLYYRIEYYNIEEWTPILVDFSLIDVDEYLDMMIDQKLILK